MDTDSRHREGGVWISVTRGNRGASAGPAAGVWEPTSARSRVAWLRLINPN